MTVTPPEPDTFNLGPGELHIGATGTLIDVSCLINNAVIAADKDQGDSTTKLCGTVKPGATTYTYTLSGNTDTDLADAAGFFALSQTAAGTQQDFTFIPSTEAGTEATGKLIIDPLDFGGDESGQPMTSDFEFAIVDKPTYTFSGTPLAADGTGETVEPPATVERDTYA
jgi:hypothetical protein